MEKLQFTDEPVITGKEMSEIVYAGLMDSIQRISNDIADLIEEIVAQTSADPSRVAAVHTELQRGLMALARAVARPTTF